MRPLFALLLVGCGSEWSTQDLDGDGYSVAQGDCFDNPDKTATNGLSAAEIYPGKSNETYYDGIDENCDGADDFDKDGDGRQSLAFGGDDCWDDPDAIPDDFVALLGYYQPLAREVLPGAEEVWYDGVDENCDGASDFDQDLDGHDSAYHDNRSGGFGDDCFDAEGDDFDNEAGLAPNGVSPSEVETWYDGTDQDCDGADDFDQDGDGFVIDDECDDTDPAIFPNDNAEIWYDGVDGNCDSLSDFDQDLDGFDSAEYGGDDCNDDPSAPATAINGYPNVVAVAMYPGASDTAYDGVDANCAGDSDFDGDRDGQDSDDIPDEAGQFGTDCNDADGTVYLGAPENWYDGIDGDCSSGSDYDQDGDGYDSSSFGFGSHDDCDDARASVHPGATETCSDAADENCDGNTNDAGATGCTAFYNDADGDGYGDLADSSCLCTATGTYTEVGVTGANDDCNDSNAAVNPGVALEDCSTTSDDNCSGSENEIDATACSAFYVDADGDGYGDPGASECWCAASGDFAVANDDDCDDTQSGVRPGATETCDGEDDDCDGSIDEFTTHYYADVDLDGYGDDSTASCTSSAGAVTTDGDCNDADARIYPAAPELCDEQQNDCDATSWSAIDEEGVVSFATVDDEWSDITSEWEAGTLASPVLITMDTGVYSVCPGTWYVSLSASGQEADVIGPYGAADTVLDYGGGTRTVVTATNSTLYLEGLTITGGAGTTAGSNTYGGGVMSFATTSTSEAVISLQSCIVTGNTATYGAGVASYSYGDIELVDTDVFDNVAATAGGGIYVQKGAVSCTDSGVYSNSTAGTEGGGAWFGYSQGQLYSTNCDWTGNSPDDVAGTASGFATKADSSYGTGATFTCSGFSGCTP